MVDHTFSRPSTALMQYKHHYHVTKSATIITVVWYLNLLFLIIQLIYVSQQSLDLASGRECTKTIFDSCQWKGAEGDNGQLFPRRGERIDNGGLLSVNGRTRWWMSVTARPSKTYEETRQTRYIYRQFLGYIIHDLHKIGIPYQILINY
jgi:hypothetical protein